MQLVRHGVRELGGGLLRVEIQEDGRVRRELEDEAVRLRLDHDVHLRADHGLLGQVRKDAPGRGHEILLLPGVERAAERRRALGEAGREDERLELAVREVAVKGGLSLLEPHVGLAREDPVEGPVAADLARVLRLESREDGLGLRGVEAEVDALVRGRAVGGHEEHREDESSRSQPHAPDSNR